MNKYYKAEDAIRAFEEMQNCYNGWSDTFDKAQIIGVLEELPTIDIVHCGECKCCRNELIEEYMPLYIYCEKWNHETDFDGFCSAGERIDNE